MRRWIIRAVMLAYILCLLSGCGKSEEGVKHDEKLPPGRVPQMKKK